MVRSVAVLATLTSTRAMISRAVVNRLAPTALLGGLIGGEKSKRGAAVVFTRRGAAAAPRRRARRFRASLVGMGA